MSLSALSVVFAKHIYMSSSAKLIVYAYMRRQSAKGYIDQSWNQSENVHRSYQILNGKLVHSMISYLKYI